MKKPGTSRRASATLRLPSAWSIGRVITVTMEGASLCFIKVLEATEMSVSNSASRLRSSVPDPCASPGSPGSPGEGIIVSGGISAAVPDAAEGDETGGGGDGGGEDGGTAGAAAEASPGAAGDRGPT